MSVGWNGFCFFDLMIKKHYRFDRRVCILVDVIIALVLLVTGFLNFAYDAVIYFALELASGAQVRLEIAAIVLLGLAWYVEPGPQALLRAKANTNNSISHIAFFCYGCRDPAAAAMNFEHVPLDSTAPVAPSDGDYDLHTLRSNAGQMGASDDLVEIDLGKKVKMYRFPIKVQEREVKPQDTNMRTPPRTPREDTEHKRLGFVGAPSQIATPQQQLNHDAAVNSEETAFLQAHAASEWI